MHRRRVDILLYVFLALGAVLLARLAQIQIAWHHLFQEEVYERTRGDRLLETPRGSIFTQDGVALARDVAVFDIAVHYPRLEEQQWRHEVRRVLDVSPDEIQRRVQAIRRRVERAWESVRRRTKLPDLRIREQTHYHPVIRDVPVEVAAAIRSQPELFPSVRIAERAVRRYPHGTLAPHIVGQMGAVNWQRLKASGMAWAPPMSVARAGGKYLTSDTAGVSGIEKACEKLLRGTRGFVRHRLQFLPLKVAKRSHSSPPTPGCDVHLTVRRDFQQAANEALRWAADNESLHFTKGALVILDVRDGAVLAAATYPSYDLNTYREEFSRIVADERSPLLFRPTQAALPMGSVYKVVTATAGLEEGKIVPSTTIHCAGSVAFGRRRFRCTAHHGDCDLLRAIQKSCNSYFFTVGKMVGEEALAKWGSRYGLGRLTGVGLPFEKSGQVRDARKAYSLYGALNLSIGQGDLLCTPLQVARMVAAIANGGRMVRPHLLLTARGPDGRAVKKFEPHAERLPVRAETLEVIRKGMRLAVQSGTARHAGLDRFQAAGKTGTAHATRRLNHAWFAGFAPYDEPRVAFAVYSERTPGHGGRAAAPIVTQALGEIWPEVLKM